MIQRDRCHGPRYCVTLLITLYLLWQRIILFRDVVSGLSIIWKYRSLNKQTKLKALVFLVFHVFQVRWSKKERELTEATDIVDGKNPDVGKNDGKKCWKKKMEKTQYFWDTNSHSVSKDNVYKVILVSTQKQAKFKIIARHA